jgi:hypothetical protein
MRSTARHGVDVDVDPYVAEGSGTVDAIVTADRGRCERGLPRSGLETVEFPRLFPERRIALKSR